MAHSIDSIERYAEVIGTSVDELLDDIKAASTGCGDCGCSDPTNKGTSSSCYTVWGFKSQAATEFDVHEI